jgi:hypothetical protein
MQQDSSTLDQLLALADEAEHFLTTKTARLHSLAMEDIRNACAIARGHLDLLRLHGAPVNVDDLERVLVRFAQGIPNDHLRNRYLTKLRTAAAWARMTPPAVPAITSTQSPLEEVEDEMAVTAAS